MYYEGPKRGIFGCLSETVEPRKSLFTYICIYVCIYIYTNTHTHMPVEPILNKQVCVLPMCLRFLKNQY